MRTVWRLVVALDCLLILSAVVIVAAMGQAGDFDEGYARAWARANSTGRPLYVLIGSETCGPCQRMKLTTIPAAKAAGSLDGVEVVVVDYAGDEAKAVREFFGLPAEHAVPVSCFAVRGADRWRKWYVTGELDQRSLTRFCGVP